MMWTQGYHPEGHALEPIVLIPQHHHPDTPQVDCLAPAAARMVQATMKLHHWRMRNKEPIAVSAEDGRTQIIDARTGKDLKASGLKLEMLWLLHESARTVAPGHGTSGGAEPRAA